LQCFVQGLAWCAAFLLTAGALALAVCAWFAVYVRLPVRRSGR